MTDCTFCKITKKELPADIVYEDKKTLAFLNIGPVNKGHILVIPKEHHETLFDVPDDLVKDMAVTTKKVGQAIKQAVEADGINIGMNNYKAAGQVVFHAHFHLIPRFVNDGLQLWPQGTYEDGEMSKYAAMIKTELES